MIDLQNLIVISIISLILFLAIKSVIKDKNKGGCCGCSQKDMCSTTCNKYKK